MIIDEEVFAVIIAIAIVTSALGVSLLVLPRRGEPFEAIGLLNEKGLIGNYPSVLPENSTLRLNIYVYNHNGKAELFMVKTFIVERGILPSNTTWLNTTPVNTLLVVLPDQGNSTLPFEARLSVPPGQYAFIAELWRFEPTNSSFIYTGRWVHLYFNVTTPLG